MTIICTVFFGIVVIVFSFFDFKNGKLVGHIVRCWARSIFVASRIKTKITGLENLDISKNYIFAANHASSLDIPLMLGYLPFWTVPIAKIELKWIPFLGWAMQMAGHVFVDRRNHENAMLSIENIKSSLIKKPRSILVFPEGSRTDDGKINQFKSGGLSIGIATKIPVAPVAINGTYESLKKGSKKFTRKILEIKIGKPVLTNTFSDEDRKRLSQIVREKVKALKE